jgi:hypothetical protein
LLVTAEGGRISKPDEVEVRVLARWPAADPSGAVSEREERESVVALARRLVEAEVDGVARANPLAGELEGIAARVPLYESYEQLQEELFRRLELILPAGADRSRWESHVFLPLSVRLIETVRARGLDLTGEQGRRQELNPSQREAVAAFFQEAAAGMRAVGPRDAR